MNGKRCSLEDTAPIFNWRLCSHVEGPLPGKVLSNHSLGLLDSRIQFTSLEDLGSQNGATTLSSKEEDAYKGILPYLVQSLEHSTDAVATHEVLGELFKEAVLRVS